AAVGDVGCYHQRGAVGLLDLGGEGLQAVAAADHERDAGGAVGEPARGDGAAQWRCHRVSSWARLPDSSRWAWAWASRSRPLCSRVATASAPAANRSGGSSWLVSVISASASLAGSP